jgi:pentatricopeptide repeat protein
MNIYTELMSSFGIERDIFTHNTFLKAYGNRGETDAMVKYLEESMINVKPDSASYNIIISVYSKVGNTQAAKRWRNKMKEEKIIPDAYTYP